MDSYVHVNQSTGDVSYNWSTGSTNDTIYNLGPGIYTVTVSDACSSQIDTFDVSYYYPVYFNDVTTDAYCDDYSGSVQVYTYNYAQYVDSFYLYNLTNGDIYLPNSSGYFDSLPSGDYTLTMIDIYGCDSIRPIHIDFIPEDFDIEVDSAISPGNIISANTTYYSPYSDSSYTYYDIEEIPFNTEDLYTGTTISNSMQDDRYSGPFSIGFDFNFFGNNVNEFWVGSNGWISFSPLSSPTIDPWQTLAIPNPAADHPRNAIFALYRDWYPNGNSSITYYTTGYEPNRKLVVNFTDMPLFYCTAVSGTFQIILYESSNIIDINIVDGPACLQWNGGHGISGIQNAEGTLAYVINSLNNTAFERYNYSLRYTACKPQWYDPAGNLIAEGNNVSFVAESTGTYSVESCTYCGFEVKEFEINYQNLDVSATNAPDTSMCQGQIDVFPNPNNGEFFINGELESLQELSINVFNSSGQKVYSQLYYPSTKKLMQRIKLNNMLTGLYYLEVQQANERCVWKLMLE